MRTIRLLGILAVVAFAGCGEGRVRPPPTTVHTFNAASNLGTVTLLREGSLLAQIGYADGTRTVFDSGPYDFHLETIPAGSRIPERRFTLSEDLSPDRDYTFVVIAPEGEPEIVSVSTGKAPDDLQDIRWTLIHAFEGLGELDVYVEEPGTDLTTATPRGRIGFGDQALTFQFSLGVSRLYLTTPDDPANVIFESTNQLLLPGFNEVLVISDPGNLGTLDILVSRVAANTVRLGQIGQESSLRAINATNDRLDRDVYLDDTTTMPLFPALPFGTITPYSGVAAIQHEIITTPIDNPGTEEGSVAWFGSPGRLFTVLIGGDASDGVVHHLVAEDKRSITGQATLRLLNGAGLFGLLWVYLVEPGTDVTTVNPNLEIGSPASTSNLPIKPGDYEIYVQDTVTDTMLAGPQPVTMDDGGVYGILLLNAADGNTVDIQLFDDFVP